MMDKSHWPRVKFGDVVQLNRDRIADPEAEGIERYVGLEHLEPDDLRIRSWGLVADGTTFTNYFQTGQVLFGKRHAYQRKVAVADFDGVCSGDIYVFEPKDPDVLLPDLLPFICQTEAFFEHAVGTSAGSLSPRTNWTQLAKYEFALPPLEEQHRIAHLLSAIEVTKEAYYRTAADARKLWNASSAHYFSGIENEVSLDKLLLYASDGPFGSKLKTEHYTTSGVQVIRLQNIEWRCFNNSERAYISDDYYMQELSRYTVCPGDVLIAGLGDDNVNAGRACTAPNSLNLAINKADCYCLRPNECLDADFLVAFLNSPHGLRQSMSYSQGTTRYRLNLGNIKRMQIPLPDGDVQHKIACSLREIHDAEISSSRRLKEITRLSQKVMKYLF